MPAPLRPSLRLALLFAASLVAAITITPSGPCLRRAGVRRASTGRGGGRGQGPGGWRKLQAKKEPNRRARLRPPWLRRNDPQASGGGEGGGEGGTVAPAARLRGIKEPAGKRRSRVPLRA